MSNTEFVFVRGKAKWFKHEKPDPTYLKWSHVLYPDNESLEKLRDLQSQGMKNLIRKDEDGWYITLSRPAERKTRDGTRFGMNPPEILMADGTPLRLGTKIGNGSDVTTKLEVYSHKTPGGGKAKAARWLSTRIDNLVPFEKSRDFGEEENRAIKGLEEQPEQLF
jgi:hypothetical protein